MKTIAVLALVVAGCSQPIHPKIPIDVARQTALEKVQGRVVVEELESEDGRDIYSFEIKPSGETRAIIKEVNVDANTGEVVGVDEEPAD